jgi:transposase, IS5 family
MTTLMTAPYRTVALDRRMLAVHAKPSAHRPRSRQGVLSTPLTTLAKRYPNSRRHGRLGYPAEVVLRLLILKHVRNWSYAVLEREVRANLVYRDFTRVGGGKMADAKTMAAGGSRSDLRW